MRKILLLSLLLVCGCSVGGKSFRVDVMNPAAKLYDRGMDAYRRGDVEAAIRAFRDVVEYYPTNDLADEALYMLATCYYDQGNYVNAYAYYKLYMARFPTGKRYDEVKDKVERLKKILKEESHGGGGDSGDSLRHR